MNTAWDLFTAPEAEPVTTKLVKDHLRVTSTDEDVYIDALTKAARQLIEERTGRSIRQQTWEYQQDCFSDEIWLPRAAPLQAVTHVKYYDSAGVQQTLATSVYLVDSKSEPARIVIAPNQVWPTIQDRALAITVRYVTGYAQNTVPLPLVQALLLLVGHWYLNREPVVPGSVIELPLAVSALLAPYSVFWREPRAA